MNKIISQLWSMFHSTNQENLSVNGDLMANYEHRLECHNNKINLNSWKAIEHKKHKNTQR